MQTATLPTAKGSATLLLASYDGSSTYQLPSPRRPLHDTSARPAPPGAALRRDSALADWPWPLCPTRGHGLYRSPRTGRLQPKMCGAIRCWACIVPVANGYARAIALAEPDQLLRFSLVGDDWPTIRRRVNRYRQRLRKLGVAVQDAYHVEPNPLGTGNHVHMWVWGDPLLEPSVRDAALAAGMGFEVDVRPAYLLDRAAGPMQEYGMKAVLERPEGTSSMPEQAQQYLTLNGGRLLHSTRQFWRDAATGERLSGVRAAAVAARNRTHRDVTEQVAA